MFARLFSPPEVSPPEAADGRGADAESHGRSYAASSSSPTASTPTRALFRDGTEEEDLDGAEGVDSGGRGGRAVIDSPTGPWSVGDFFPARGESKRAATRPAEEQTPTTSSTRTNASARPTKCAQPRRP